MNEHVYELVDASSDEMYYPIALFESLEEAIDALSDAHEGVENNDDYIKVEVRQRKLGKYEWSGVGLVVASKEWERDYESEGCYGWKPIEPSEEDKR